MTRHSLTTSRWTVGFRQALLLAGLGCTCLAPIAVAGCGAHAASTTVSTTVNTSASASSIEVPPRVAKLTGLTTAVAAKPTRPRILEMRGSLALDVNRLVHVHARFPGQIVHLETIEEEMPASPTAPRIKRTLNFMDRVTKGQRLAQIWSKDLGEKKSELVDAMVQLRIDQINLKFNEDLLRKGATTEKSVREGQRNVQIREIAVAKAERTLRSWSLTDEEIQEVRKQRFKEVRASAQPGSPIRSPGRRRRSCRGRPSGGPPDC